MAAEPINIFSHRIDPRGVLDLLRRLAPGLAVDGPPDDWRRVTLPVPPGHTPYPGVLVFTHGRDYYAGPGWPRQMAGMQGYFSRFPATDRTPQVMRLIRSFRFSLGTFFEPDRVADDDRLGIVCAVARHLDGAIFTPSSLRDAGGRALVSAGGECDADAVFPAMPPEADHPEAGGAAAADAAAAAAAAGGGDDEDVDEPTPPTPERVARRALALAAVAGRALLEQEPPADPHVQETWQGVLRWIKDVGIGDELEPQEWKVLQRPLGQVEWQDALNATWRLEGLGALAWALNRYDLPPHDELVTPGQLLPAAGILNADRAKALLSEPRLRPAAEIEAMANRLFAIHWRLRNFRLRPEAMDFAEFARTAWFGPVDITGVRLIDNDIAIGDHPIAAAPQERVRAAESAAVERHLAINWLTGNSVVYSETDVST